MKVSPHKYVLLPPAIYCPPPFQQKNGAERRREREIETERVSKIWLSISSYSNPKCVLRFCSLRSKTKVSKKRERERGWKSLVRCWSRRQTIFLKQQGSILVFLVAKCFVVLRSWITSSFCVEVLFPLSSWKRLTSSNVSSSSSYSFSLCGDYGFCHLLHFISMICFIVSDI